MKLLLALILTVGSACQQGIHKRQMRKDFKRAVELNEKGLIEYTVFDVRTGKQIGTKVVRIETNEIVRE